MVQNAMLFAKTKLTKYKYGISPHHKNFFNKINVLIARYSPQNCYYKSIHTLRLPTLSFHTRFVRMARAGWKPTSLPVNGQLLQHRQWVRNKKVSCKQHIHSNFYEYCLRALKARLGLCTSKGLVKKSTRGANSACQVCNFPHTSSRDRAHKYAYTFGQQNSFVRKCA